MSLLYDKILSVSFAVSYQGNPRNVYNNSFIEWKIIRFWAKWNAVFTYLIYILGFFPFQNKEKCIPWYFNK